MNGTITLEDTFAGNGIVNGMAYTDNMTIRIVNYPDGTAHFSGVMEM